MARTPQDDPRPAAVNAHATPKAVMVEIRSFGVSVLAAMPPEEANRLAATLDAAAATCRAMQGTDYTEPDTDGSGGL